jgi:hypothetical protein
MGLQIKTNDTVEADIDVQSLSIDANGNVTVIYQKVLKDTTDNTTTNDGDPVTIQLEAADASNVLAAIAPVLTPIVTAEPPAAKAE